MFCEFAVFEHQGVGLHAATAAVRDHAPDIPLAHTELTEAWQLQPRRPLVEQFDQAVLRRALAVEHPAAEQDAGLGILLQRRAAGFTLAQGLDVGAGCGGHQGAADDPVRDREEGAERGGETVYRAQPALGERDARAQRGIGELLIALLGERGVRRPGLPEAVAEGLHARRGEGIGEWTGTQ